MNKKDLKDGMTLICRNGYEIGYYKEHLIDIEHNNILTLDGLNEDLTNKEQSEFDICTIIQDDSILWKRKDIDWSKIEVGTKVKVSNDNKEWFQASFIKKFSNDMNFYVITLDGELSFWKYCKIVREYHKRAKFDLNLDDLQY